jgi:ketosteroid isomerase-like protein
MQNKRLAVCLVCVAFGVPLFAQDLEQTRAEKQVWGLSQSLLSRMWPTANEEGALALMHEDVAFWTSSVALPLDKNHMAARLATLKPGRVSHNASLVSVKVHGNVAIVFFLLEISEKNSNGESPITTSRVTHTWKKQGGKWLLIRVMDAPSEAKGTPETSAVRTSVSPAEESKANDPAGFYTLVAVNGSKLPATVSHGEVEIQVHSGAFTINADGTCSTKTIFGIPSGDKITREVSATYTQAGSRLNMQWQGAGKNSGTVEGVTFTMDNEGMKFMYKRQPR